MNALPGRSRLAYRRGYTLPELMAALGMVAIMAVLALAGYRRYLDTVKSAEGKDLVTTISAGQTGYFESTQGYLSCGTNLTDYYPSAPNRQKRTLRAPANPQAPCYDLLGVDSQAPSYFSLVTVAGLPSDSVPSLPTTGSFTPAPGRPWFVAMAVSDIDGDSNLGYFSTTSFSPGDVATLNEGE
ncbi:MAG: prepilin-type N-terminal cleavage/methylation domain-containing protein [Myxococcota bacterium]